MRKKQLWGNQGPHLSHRVPRTWASAQVRSSLLICSVPWKLEMGDRAGPSDDTQGSIPMFLLQNVAEPQKAATFQMEPNVEMAWWNHFSIAHLSEHSELWPMANKCSRNGRKRHWQIYLLGSRGDIFQTLIHGCHSQSVICVIPFRLMSTGKNIPALFYQPASTSHL